MVNRIKFFESVNGIQYPDMIIKFFDHFLALRWLVEDKGIIDIMYSKDNAIAFSITFQDSESTTTAINYMISNPRVLIYGRLISVNVNILTDKKIEVILQ